MFWNEYKSKIQTVATGNAGQNIDTKRTLLDATSQGVNRLFVAGYNVASVQRNIENSHRKYYLPRFNIKDYNVMIDGRNFYGQNINDNIKMYD